MDTEIPLFDLSASKSYIVAAGGGGNKEYGKENGIIVIDKSLGKIKQENFYKTEDFIKSVEVFYEGQECDDFEEDDLSLDQDSSSDDLESIPEIDSSPEENLDPPAETDKKKEENNSEIIYIAAAGDTFFYLLKFDGIFCLIKKMKHQVASMELTKHLFILYRSNLYGFYDCVNNFDGLKLRTKLIEESSEGQHEEYLYNLYKKGKKIVYKREDGSLDVPRDWDGFFIADSKVHKIVFKEDKSVFVYKNNKYSIDGEISKVYLMKDDTIVFYSSLKAEGFLYFIKDKQKVFQLQRITSIAVNDNSVAVSTCSGDAIVYINKEFYCKIHIADLPITGIVIDNGTLYYSVINGIVDKTSIRKSNIFYLGFLIAIFFIIIAIIAGRLKKF